MKLELNEYREVLEFQEEHQLTSGALRMDTLIVKKLNDVFIDKNIAHIFKNYRKSLKFVFNHRIICPQCPTCP
jgi:hypothetical protein